MSENVPEPSEKPAPEPGKTEAAKPIALTPRQSAASGDRAPAPVSAPVPVPADAAAINQQLMSALAQALTGQAPPPVTAAKDDRGLISREEKRFRRAGASGRSDVPGDETQILPAPPTAATTTNPVPTTPTSVAAASDAGIAENPVDAGGEAGFEESKTVRSESSSRRPRFSRDNTPAVLRPNAPQLRTIWRQMPNTQRGAILGVVGLLLAFLGFMVGRATAPSDVPTVPSDRTTPVASAVGSAAVPLSSRLAEPHEIKLIDDAMVAQTNGDFLTAEKLLQQLMQQAPDIAGNQTAMALLSLQKGDLVNADYFIKLGLDAGEDPGRLYGLRGMIQMRLMHPRRANEAFQMATRSAPHQFKGFQLWAEFLRRIGKNQEALGRFDQAIARVHEQADDDLMQFKRRLTLIAAGRGNELETELQQQLAISPPSGDWLLIAMAKAAQNDDFKTAAKYLEIASRTMNQDALVDRLRDFYLYQWCYEKELEPYFRPLQARLSAARRSEPVATETKDGDDQPIQNAAPTTPVPFTR
jgi:tetratricopeptide (TPR) repeat protein